MVDALEGVDGRSTQVIENNDPTMHFIPARYKVAITDREVLSLTDDA
jgi:hypothetical protein